MHSMMTVPHTHSTRPPMRHKVKLKETASQDLSAVKQYNLVDE